jgi:hypothetical protein
MRRPIKTAVSALLLGLVATGTATADGTRLVFSALDTSTGTAGVMSELYRRENNGDPIRVTPQGQPAQGFDYDEADCKVTVQYTLLPVLKAMYTYMQDDWRSCAAGGTYQYKFTPNLTTPKLKVVYSLFGAASPALAGLEPEQVKIFNDALEQQDFGTISFLSTELGNAYYAAGKYDLASQWKSAALATGWEALSIKYAGVAVEQPFTLENDALRYTPEAVGVIKQYQVDAGIAASGKLNWPTLRSLSDLAGSDIQTLSTQREKVLREMIR